MLVECLTQLKHDRALPQLKVLQYLVLFINTGEAFIFKIVKMIELKLFNFITKLLICDLLILVYDIL